MPQKKVNPHVVASLLLAMLAILAMATVGRAQTLAPQGSETPTPEPVVAEATPIPHTLIGRSNCLICHAEGFEGAGIIPTDHTDYTNDDCEDCHAQGVESESTPVFSGSLQGVAPPPIEHPEAEGINTCFECHVELGDDHTVTAEDWRKSVHGKAEVGCADCHGGDPRTDEMNLSMTPDAGYLGAPRRAIIPEICGGCHSDVERMRQYNLPTDQYAKYVESVHGAKIKEGDTQVAICSDCHGSHDVKKASDPAADVYPLNIPALCAQCHADAELMEPYGIPTDQYDLYKESIHGQVLLNEQYLQAPNCTSCHGSHDAAPPDSKEVINVCGKCHTATEDYYFQSLHSRLGDNGPKCWTCHGTHDVTKTDENLFLSQNPQDQEQEHCGTCHVDDTTFRIDKSRFEQAENRRCDTCHHEGARIMVQVEALHNALTEANQEYRGAEETISKAAGLGMIVTEAESRLAEARTSLIRARAATHTTKLPAVTKLTDEATASASDAQQIAADKVNENFFRRWSMIIAVAIILIIIATLLLLKRQLDQRLQK